MHRPRALDDVVLALGREKRVNLKIPVAFIGDAQGGDYI
jgi:hypothetical protein